MERIKTLEKRRFRRLKLHTSLRCQRRGSQEFFNAVGQDICEEGICLAIEKFISPSNNVSLQINVLSKILNPIGRVVWSFPLPHSNRYHLGIEFLEFDPNERKYLSDFIEMQTSKR